MKTKKQTTAKSKISTAKKVAKKPTKTRVVLTKKKNVAKLKTAATKKTIGKSKTIGFNKSSLARRVGRKKESAAKRIAYTLLSMILGLSLGAFVRVFLELVYMKKASENGMILSGHNWMGMYTYLPKSVEYFVLALSLIFGIWLSLWGWKIVYVQHKHRIFKKA